MDPAKDMELQVRVERFPVLTCLSRWPLPLGAAGLPDIMTMRVYSVYSVYTATLPVLVLDLVPPNHWGHERGCSRGFPQELEPGRVSLYAPLTNCVDESGQPVPYAFTSLDLVGSQSKDGEDGGFAVLDVSVGVSRTLAPNASASDVVHLDYAPTVRTERARAVGWTCKRGLGPARPFLTAVHTVPGWPLRSRCSGLSRPSSPSLPLSRYRDVSPRGSH